MQSQLDQIGDLPQSAVLWHRPEESALVYAFYLLLADPELEDVFADFTAGEKQNVVEHERAQGRPSEPL
jgi:hypothetical protein